MATAKRTPSTVTSNQTHESKSEFSRAGRPRHTWFLFDPFGSVIYLEWCRFPLRLVRAAAQSSPLNSWIENAFLPASSCS